MSCKRWILISLLAWCCCVPAQVPGLVIDYSPPSSGRYIGSPSIVILPNGDYVASHDFFGPGSTSDQTRIFLSQDRGRHWQMTADLAGQFWSNLFVHRRLLYILGTGRQYGPIVIRRSPDGGRTWSVPKDAHTGLLRIGSEYHCAPMPVVEHNGRLWRAFEERNPPEKWGVNFLALVLSAPVDADLLEASSWNSSNGLRYQPEWGGSAWLEGNIVKGRDGRLYNILRNHYPQDDRAAMIQISKDGHSLQFDPQTGFVPLPGATKKFTLRWDKKSKLYWSLSNAVQPQDRGGNVERTRNHLALISSPDLRTWSVRKTILYHPDKNTTGFQYADWQFDGADLIVVIRTAIDDGREAAHNCHDANYLIFYRIAGFRNF